ncbi:MAG: efflux RND transporter periplasmic adaptor subunit [Prolixibacteraceae bacterium]|jgi:cobalt-zinc-cadmium efflux system membrane fusion protein|nr:efflux RND transporter periplasmic adaptor subunit [Prolixibacteraceae bacterium]
MQKIFIIVGVAAMALLSCSHPEKSGQAVKESRIQTEGNIVVVPEGSPVSQKIRLQSVIPANYHAHYTTTGTVRVITGSMAEISTPFEGRITKSFVRLGQKVLAGTPVFEIYSPDYFETVKSFVQAKQEKQLATANYDRQKDLREHGVGSKKELEEAEAAWQIAGREYEKSEASLLIFNVKPEEISLGKPLIVRSPIAGEIVKNNITVGQYLKNDAEPQTAVANLGRVWVVAQVKEKNISLINSIDSVHVITDAHPDKPISGIVSYVGSLLDEQTRSVEVYVECRNDNKTLKPGMFANVSFTRQIHDAMVIPASAILQGEVHAYVFVQTEKNKFVKRDVSVTTGNEKELIVNSGLSANETIVAEGAVYLR